MSLWHVAYKILYCKIKNILNMSSNHLIKIKVERFQKNNSRKYWKNQEWHIFLANWSINWSKVVIKIKMAKSIIWSSFKLWNYEHIITKKKEYVDRKKWFFMSIFTELIKIISSFYFINNHNYPIIKIISSIINSVKLMFKKIKLIIKHEFIIFRYIKKESQRTEIS